MDEPPAPAAPQGAPPHPAAWRWLRWGLPVCGAALVWSGFMGANAPLWQREALPSHPAFPLALAGALAAGLALAAVKGFRLPVRRYLVPAIAFQALGATVLVAGFALFLFSGGLGHCGLTPSSASWQDPSLYAAMPAPGTLAGHDMAWAGPAPGLPFDAPSLRRSWGGHNLTRLSWSYPFSSGMGGASSFDLEPPGDLHLSVPSETPAAQVRSAFLAWSALATSAGNATREGWADAFLASARPGGSYLVFDGGAEREVHDTRYSLAIPGPYRLEALHAALDAAGALGGPGGRHPVGSFSQEAGAWSFTFSLPVRSLEAQGGAYRLEADSLGAASFEGLERGERPREAYAQEAVTTLRSLGLPAPDPATLDVGGVIC